MMEKETKISPELKEELIIYRRMQKDPFLFIKLMWNLIPQPLKENKENDSERGTKKEHYESYIR